MQSPISDTSKRLVFEKRLSRPQTALAGTYELEEKIGEGGMGEIYRATNITLNIPCAVKFLSQKLSDRDEGAYKERFLTEARAAARVNHENIVRVTAFEETPEGRLYYVMEYVDGKDLSNIINPKDPLTEKRTTKPMDWRRAKTVITQLCSALEAVHEQGIIHRDIKLQNIMLVKKKTGEDSVKVIDFGIAKILGEKGNTQTNQTLGTPQYMAPEQFDGENNDARIDVYAVGSVMYALLTGRPPFYFEGEGVFGKYMKAKQKELPPPPSAARPDLVIPKDIEAVVMKALQISPKHRYSSMTELKSAFEKCIGSDSGAQTLSPQSGPSTLGTSPKMQKESGTAAKVLGGIAAVLGATAIGAYLLASNGEKPAEPVQAPPVVSVDAAAERSAQENNDAGFEAVPDVQKEAKPDVTIPDVQPEKPKKKARSHKEESSEDFINPFE
jgi:serine/threonine-protein kinase